MSELAEKHINYIKQDLEFQGLIHEGLEDEIVDHVCSLVEKRMQDGTRFIEAYRSALTDFGGFNELRQVQNETLKFENYKTKLMLRNYLKIAYRNIVKHKFYSLINVLGLAIGITCCLLIMLYVKDELSFDRHLPNSDRIYRVVSNHMFSGNEFHAAVTPAPLASALVEDFPEVEVSTRIRNAGSIVFKKGESAIKEPSCAYVDSTFFKVFAFNVIEGNPETALVAPNSVVLTKSIARKYFGDEPAVGKLITTSQGAELMVTAVMQDIPVNTHFHIPIFISMGSWSRANNHNWLSNNFHTYFLLRKGYDPNELEGKFQGMVIKYIGPQLQEVAGMSIEEAEAKGSKAEFNLQPLTSIHLYSDYTLDLDVNGDITYVYIFSSIAIFILIIACINFMNMSTARSASRAKEVGIRKVLGSYRSHLIRQFLSESIILSFGASIISVLLSVLLLPFFNELSSKSISIPISSPIFISSMIAGSIVLGIIAGFYPAFFLSGFKPSQVLKGIFKSRGGVTNVRSVLVTFQFFISVLLILGTLIIGNQLNFIQHKKLGFNKDQIIIIRNAYLLGNQLQSYKNELISESSVNDASISTFYPVGGPTSDNTFFPMGSIVVDKGVNMQNWTVDHDYISTYGMKIVNGRDFSRDFPSDSSAVIINESAAKRFDFENPVGQIITEFYWDPKTGSISRDSLLNHTIIGVVQDFHFSSLKKNIGPLLFRLGQSRGSISVNFRSENASEIIMLAEDKWKTMAPGQPFEYFFVDDQFNNLYKAERRTGEIFATFSGLAIFVACLGLFALSAYTSEQRTKEIGVRKVLGATEKSIILLLSKEFGRLVLIAFIIAVPVGWYAMNMWLSQFAYKKEPGLIIYVAAGIIALLVAFVTMSFQSIKAARANPVDSLRSE